MSDVIERAAQVLSTLTTCDGQPYATELHRRQARALADAGMLARPVPTRDEVRRVLEHEFWPFLAHSPHNPETFWGEATDAVMDLMKGQNS